MKIGSMMVALPLLLSGAAFADGNQADTQVDYGSIRHHQAAAGKIEITGQLEYLDKVVKLNDNSQNTIPGGALASVSTRFNKGDVSGLGEIITGEYGINDHYAISLRLITGSLKVKPDPTPGTYAGKAGIEDSWTQSGIEDPTIALNSRYDHVGPGTLRWGVPVSFSLEKHKIDQNLDANLQTGGLSFAPYVAYEKMFGLGSRIGINFQYSASLTNRHIENDSNIGRIFHGASVNGALQAQGGVTNYTAGGASSFEGDVYFEQWFSRWFNLGVAAGYADMSTTKEFYNGVTHNLDNGVSGFMGGIYGTFITSTHLFITPVFMTSPIGNVSDQPHVKSVTQNAYSVYAVYMF